MQQRAQTRYRYSVGLVAVAVLTLGLAQPTGAYQRPGATLRASVASDGTEAKVSLPLNPSPAYELCGHSQPGTLVDLSRTGRYVVFSSIADNLVASDTNLLCDSFVHDMKSGLTLRVSTANDGSQAVGLCPINPGVYPQGSFAATISADGRYVAFSSCAANLVPGDTNLMPDVFVHDRRTKETLRASLTSTGGQSLLVACAPAVRDPVISANGRVVSFSSCARDLVPDDSNESMDVFVRDLVQGTTVRASVANDGSQPSSAPLTIFGASSSISADGRQVAFYSDAALVDDDSNLRQDVYVRDLEAAKTERVSVATGGQQALDGQGSRTWSWAGGRQISADGRYVSFSSDSSALVPNDQPAHHVDMDVFVRDRLLGRTERLSVLPSGRDPNCIVEVRDGGYDGWLPTISANGRYVQFQGQCPLFSSGPDSGDYDAYIADRRTGAIEWVSVSPDGTGAQDDPDCPNGGGSQPGALSFDGQMAAFLTCASNVVADDTNDLWDVFVRDRGPVLGIGGLAADDSELSVSGDQTFSTTGLIDESDSIGDVSRVVSRRGANLFGVSIAYRPQYDDLFVRIQLEDMPYGHGTSLAGDPAVLYGFDLTANDTRYQIRAQRFASDSIEGLDPVQLASGGASFGLFKCNDDTPLCTKVATLKGGYGTTGVEVVVALPLSWIGLQAGGELSDLQAFTALGSYDVGAVKVLDSMTLPN